MPIYAKQREIMQKNWWKTQTAKFTVFARGSQLCGAKIVENYVGKLKRELLQIFNYCTTSMIRPYENWRPEDSENVVVFVCSSF